MQARQKKTVIVIDKTFLKLAKKTRLNLGINNQQTAVPRLQGLSKKEEKKKIKTSWIDRETSEIVDEEEKNA